MKRLWIQLLLISLFGIDVGLSYWPQDSGHIYTNNQNNNPNNNHEKSYFLSNTETFRVRIGGEVTLPCYVANLGNDVITWTTGDRLLTAGPVKVYNEERLIHNHNGSEITLRDVQPRDSGEFRCQVNNVKEPMILTHTLDVLIPPKIVSRKPEVRASIREEVHLECVAHGNPQPVIQWRRQDGSPLRVNTIGHRIILYNLVQSDAGVYECIADNGVDNVHKQPVIDQVYLIVDYPPSITVENQEFIPQMGHNLQLNCIVHGSPTPDVNWRKGRKVLGSRDRNYNLTRTHNNQYILSIHKVKEEDLGNYTCRAENNLGVSEQILVVSGRPVKPVLLPGFMQSKHEYKLRWRITSAFAILGHKIQYMLDHSGKLGQVCTPLSAKNCILEGRETYTTLECEERRYQYSVRTDAWTGYRTDLDGGAGQPGGHHLDNDCVKLNISAGQRHISREFNLNIEKDMEYILKNLRPKSHYILQVQTINDFGASEWSDVFSFKTLQEPVSALAPWSPFSSAASRQLGPIQPAVLAAANLAIVYHIIPRFYTVIQKKF